MPQRTWRIQGPLAALADVVWVYDYDQHALPHTLERILPNGSIGLIVNLRDDIFRIYDQQPQRGAATYRGPLVSGPQTDYVVIDTAQQACSVGIQFKPGGASACLGIPASELSGAHVPLDQVWGSRALELRDRLLEAHTPEDKFALLAGILLERAAHSPSPHPAMTYALQAFDSVPQTRTIGDVIESTGLSPRRFNNLFRETVGMTPKRYCRVRRFQVLVGAPTHANHVNWARIAATLGYYDQAHLIHDFRAFTGLTPTAYLALRGKHPNHVPLSN